MLVHRDDRLVSYAGVLLRQAILDETAVFVGGIGGVKTHPDERSKGYAALGIARAIDFFVERRAGFALLVCDDGLVGYYERLGWRLFAGEMLTRQRGASVPFSFNRVMVLEVMEAAPSAGKIDLLGPPW